MKEKLLVLSDADGKTMYFSCPVQFMKYIEYWHGMAKEEFLPDGWSWEEKEKEIMNSPVQKIVEETEKTKAVVDLAIGEFKQGVSDAMIHGIKHPKYTSSLYHQGFEFGQSLFDDVAENLEWQNQVQEELKGEMDD